MKKYTAANWNRDEDSFTQTIFQQLRSQIWFSEEISLSPDLKVWTTLPKEVRDAYVRNLGVLTFLDTHQGNEGMNIIGRSLSDDFHQRKATLSFIEMTENAIHAKSYSSIFTTYLPTNKEILDVFEWCENNQHLQAICDIIISIYKNLDKHVYCKSYGQLFDGKEITQLDYDIAQWKAMVASTFLETYLFYSGFYYPLWFYGQGKLMQAGEIINLILRDESIHGVYIGALSQELYRKFDSTLQKELYDWSIKLLELLYSNQLNLIEEMYNPVGLAHDVKVFVRYNANKALLNVGFEPHFDEEEVNPIVLNGLNTKSKQMDFFSMKGNGYQSMIAKSLTTDIFDEIYSFDNIVLSEQSTANNFWKQPEDKIISDLKALLIEADIYSASNDKALEDKFLEYTIKLLKRKYGEDLTTTQVVKFISSDSDMDDFKTHVLLNVYNQDSEKSIENVEIVKWMLSFFKLTTEVEIEEETDELVSDFDLTASYRRLLEYIIDTLDVFN